MTSSTRSFPNPASVNWSISRIVEVVRASHSSSLASAESAAYRRSLGRATLANSAHVCRIKSFLKAASAVWNATAQEQAFVTALVRRRVLNLRFRETTAVNPLEKDPPGY